MKSWESFRNLSQSRPTFKLSIRAPRECNASNLRYHAARGVTLLAAWRLGFDLYRKISARDERSREGPENILNKEIFWNVLCPGHRIPFASRSRRAHCARPGRARTSRPGWGNGPVPPGGLFGLAFYPRSRSRRRIFFIYFQLAEVVRIRQGAGGQI